MCTDSILLVYLQGRLEMSSETSLIYIVTISDRCKVTTNPSTLKLRQDWLELRQT